MNLRSWSVLFVVLVFLTGSVHATTYVIEPDGSGDFSTIQDAVNGAEDWDVIELANGVFSGRGNWDIDFYGKAVKICSQSGDPGTCIIDVQGVHGDEIDQKAFKFQNGETRTSILSGVTIRNGDADGC